MSFKKDKLMPPKKVLIIGSAPGYRAYKLHTFRRKIWAVFSAIELVLPRVDLAFLADPLTHRNFRLKKKKARKDWVRDKAIMRAVNEAEIINRKIPIYLDRKYKHLPTSMKYPLKTIMRYFKTDYFSDSICYMIAYAIYIGVKQIDMFGVNMRYGTEYNHEKGGVEFWLGVAMGRGIKVRVHGGRSQVLKTKNRLLYGFGHRQKSN